MSDSLNKETKKLESASEILIETATRAGADWAEVCGSFSEQSKVLLEKQDFHMASSDQGFKVGIRVLKKERLGFASSNSLDPADLKEMALSAIEIAGFAPENAFNLPAKTFGTVTPLSLWHPETHQLSVQAQKELALELLDTAKEDPRIRVNDGAVERVSSVYTIRNSSGCTQSEADAQLRWSLMGMAVEGETITSFDYFMEMVRDPQESKAHLQRTTRTFCNQLLQSLVTGPAKSYRGPVVFTPRAVVEIFLSGVSYHLNGRNLAEGTSRWKLGDQGKQPFNAKISIWDEPHRLSSLGAGAFDREGQPTQSRSLISSGRLEGFLMDQYAANALGTQSTGNAVGGPTSPPTCGAHGIQVKGGKTEKNQLIDEACAAHGHTLLVNRFSGQVDPITGDFSGVAKGAEWWENGKRRHFVKETLISGNVFEALGENLLDVSKETESVHSHHVTPWISSTNISVTGK